MSELKLFTFGPPRLERDGQPVDLNLRKALALLVYLAVTAQPQSRDLLAALLWPDSDQREARGRLRRTLHRLREDLGDAVVAAASDTISLHPAADLWRDGARFLEHATRGLHAAEGADWSPEHIAQLRAAAALYTDDFLAGWTVSESAAFDEWMFFERERLRQLLAQVLECLVQSYAAQGDWSAALPYARRWVALDPLHEAAQRQLMTAYAWAGQQAAAVRQYQECARILEAELDVAPDTATTALYDAIRFRRFPPAEDAGAPRSYPQPGAQPPAAQPAAAHVPVVPTPAGAPARSMRPVGREDEVGRLHEHLERTLRGARQIVFVAGEPGIGKTTLVNLFLATLQDAGALWIGRGQCVEQRGVGEPFMPLLEALGRLCREPGGQEVSALLAAHAPTWLVQMPGLINAEQYRELQPKVLGANRERMLRELAELITQLTSRRPLVLVLEDLHWSDYSTLDVLALLARQHDPARLLVIGTYRPADVQANGHPLHDLARELHLRGYAATLDLRLLSEPAVARYLESRLGAALVPEGLPQLLHQRTDGNPLFMVTVVDAWTEQNCLHEVDGRWVLTLTLAELAVCVPDTLRQMIELQIRQLAADDQATLEAASVAGTTFSAVEVAAAVDQEAEAVELRCTTLARQHQFLHARDTGEWPDGTLAMQFEWSHHVIRQVLYDRVTATRRARLHRQIGLRLEAGYADAARTIAADLATHFVEGRDRPRAVRYLELAAEGALNRSAHREAIDLIRLGLEQLQPWPDTSERTQHELTLQAMLAPALIATQGWRSPEAEQAFLRARDLCASLGGSRQRDQVIFGLATMLEYRAEFQRSAKLLEQHLRPDQRAGRALVVESYDLLACSLFHQGSFPAALEQAEQGLTLYDPQEQYALIARLGENPGVGCHIWAALSLWFLGYNDPALERVRLAVRQAQPQPYCLANAQSQLAFIHQMRGEYQLAQQAAALTVTVATQQGFPYRVGFGQILCGWAMALQGQGEDGIRLLHAGMATCEATGAMLDYPYFLGLLADACSHAGHVDEGLISVAGAQAMVLNSRSFYYEAELHRIKGTLLLQVARPDEAAACFAEALAVARRQQAPALELRAALSLGRLWQQQGQPAAAHTVLHDACRRFADDANSPDLRVARSLMAEWSLTAQSVG